MSGHDDGPARGFPAFPAGYRGSAEPSRAARSGFARSWWGGAWVARLEESTLESPLTRGRRFARRGHVGPITVSPGRLAATVHAEDGTPHRTVVGLGVLPPGSWRRLAERAAAQAGQVAALLDGTIPHDLVDTAADLGIALLPELGELEPACDCDGWEAPCGHAVALCYQAGWLLDVDPFVLFLLRGRSERQILDLVTAAMQPGPEAQPDLAMQPNAGTSMAPGEPTRLVVPATPGVDPDVLADLADQAASRARSLLAEATD